MTFVTTKTENTMALLAAEMTPLTDEVRTLQARLVEIAKLRRDVRARVATALHRDAMQGLAYHLTNGGTVTVTRKAYSTLAILDGVDRDYPAVTGPVIAVQPNGRKHVGLWVKFPGAGQTWLAAADLAGFRYEITVNGSPYRMPALPAWAKV
jgi:hypothetical protein